MLDAVQQGDEVVLVQLPHVVGIELRTEDVPAHESRPGARPLPDPHLSRKTRLRFESSGTTLRRGGESLQPEAIVGEANVPVRSGRHAASSTQDARRAETGQYSAGGRVRTNLLGGSGDAVMALRIEIMAHRRPEHPE